VLHQAIQSDVTINAGQAIAFRIRRDLFKSPLISQKASQPASMARIIPAAKAGVSQAPPEASTSYAELKTSVQIKSATTKQTSSLKTYLVAAAAVAAVCVALVFKGNEQFNSEMYAETGMLPAAEAFSAGENYANYDLNINIRKLRDFHIARMPKTPDMVLFGASHWQEADGGLVTHLDWYNSHIHREFWEDLFGMTYMWESHGRMPKKLIIALRDNIFAPIESRPDFLWEPGIPYWRAMADKMGLEKEPLLTSLPYARFRERFNLSMLHSNFVRWVKSPEAPQATSKDEFQSMDILMQDGSIKWSRDHLAIFTKERTLRESLSFADVKIKSPPLIEQRGVENFDKLLTYLKAKGVTVYFARPPYNPQFWDKVQGTAYMDGLKPVIEMQDKLAAKHGIKMLGSFNPHDVGCTPEQYIDSEHANRWCLKKIFDQFTAYDLEASVK
jgi:hypothetical protein